MLKACRELVVGETQVEERALLVYCKARKMYNLEAIQGDFKVTQNYIQVSKKFFPRKNKNTLLFLVTKKNIDMIKRILSENF